MSVPSRFTFALPRGMVYSPFGTSSIAVRYLCTNQRQLHTPKTESHGTETRYACTYTRYTIQGTTFTLCTHDTPPVYDIQIGTEGDMGRAWQFL